MHWGIRVLCPDINESIESFTSGQVKATCDSDSRPPSKVSAQGGQRSPSLEERERGGKFRSIYDFMERVNMQAVNRKNIENMALAGAFDSISGFHRSKFFSADQRDSGGAVFLEQLIKYGSRMQTERNTAQQSLFGGTDIVDIQHRCCPNVPTGTSWKP